MSAYRKCPPSGGPEQFFQPKARDAVDLAQRFLVFDIARRGEAALERVENIVLRAAPHGVQERKPELLAIRRIQLAKPLELVASQRIEPGALLFALRCLRHRLVSLTDTTDIGSNPGSVRLQPDRAQIRMRAQQRE